MLVPHKERTMKKGKLIVFEGIYGSGRIIVDLVHRLREALASEGKEVFEIDSPDTGRAQLMGAQDLDSSWRYGMFEPDFFFELAARARVCSVTREELAKGKTVLCKSFTLSSIVYAELNGHDWFREDLNVLEARARGVQFGGEVVPDLTLFVDVAPALAAKELGPSLGSIKPADLDRQLKLYHHELSKLPSGKAKVIRGDRPEEAVVAEALQAIHALPQ
jgi:dTMP kinase